MKAVFLTAGAAGMYCGSCMHDNSLAKAMRVQGVDCVLQPVYTPIRTDDENIASEQVFFGGIHVYLLQQLAWLRWVPASIRRTLDWAPLLRLATRRSHATDAGKLGELAISMLKGAEGRQSDEVNRLVDWLANEMKPDAILFSNLLIGGALPSICRRLPSTRLVVLLQGDDIFLDHLPGDAKDEAIRLCRQLVPHIDQFVVHSRFYADKMAAMLEIPHDKIVITPLSIDIEPFKKIATGSEEKSDSDFRLGYLARIAPEKGLHRLVDTFIRLASQSSHDDVTLHVAGWLGHGNQPYLQEQQRKIADASLSHRFTYYGSPNLEEKVAFLRKLDLLCVPTDYEEPKGLFVLESLAAGVPVVQPNHGAFAELIEATGGGLVVQPDCVDALCAAIQRLKTDGKLRARLGIEGCSRVYGNHSIESAARQMHQILFE